MIILHKQQNQYHWLQYDQAGNLLQEEMFKHLHEVPKMDSNEKVVMLFPGENVLSQQVKLPKTKKSELANAIAYSLEDQLISDVSELHFLLGDADEQGMIQVGVINKKQFNDELFELKRFGITPARLLPDFLSLPLQPQAWTVFVCGEVALVRTGVQTGFVVDANNLYPILELAIHQDKPQKLFVITDGRADLAYLKALPIDIVWQVQSPKTWLWNTLKDEAGFNMLQGSNRSNVKTKKLKNHWIMTGILCVMLLIVLIGADIMQLTQLKQSSNSLKQHIAAIYHQVFPKRVDVVEPRFTLQNYLQSLRNMQQKEQFFPLLARAGAVIKADPAIQLKNIYYADQVLKFQIQANKLADLEALTKNLSRQSLNVQQQNVATNKQFVTADIVVRSK